MSQERMHPDDLRAIMAAQLALSSGELTTGDVARGIQVADAIIAELARTAKPEDEPEFLAWRQKAWDNASRADKAEARVRELEDAIKKHRSIVKDSQHWHGCYCDEDLWSRVK